LCGGVRYEVTLPFLRVSTCHCSRCRKHGGGSGLTQGRVPREQFLLVQGEELLRVWRPADAGMAKVFCSLCGSSVFGGTWPDGPEVSIRFGTLDGDPELKPQYHTFVGAVPPWDALPEDGTPRYDGRAPYRTCLL
jgi:hypothetical protein